MTDRSAQVTAIRLFHKNPARIPLPSGNGGIAGLSREKLRTHRLCCTKPCQTVS
jgi:hypothetical protein